jgi:hypothetical protein
MTTPDDIRYWFNRAKKQPDATHLIIVLDEFDGEDFPVMVGKDENVHEVEAKYKAMPLHRVIEVYSLSQDFETQLANERNFNYT